MFRAVLWVILAAVSLFTLRIIWDNHRWRSKVWGTHKWRSFPWFRSFTWSGQIKAGKSEGFTPCVNLVLASLGQAGTLIVGFWGATPDTPTMWLYAVTGLIVPTCLLRIATLRCDDDVTRHYFNAETVHFAHLFAGIGIMMHLSIVFMGFFWWPLAPGRPSILEVSPFMIGNVNPETELIDEKTEAIQVLLLISTEQFPGEMPSRFVVDVDYLNHLNDSWRLSSASRAFIGPQDEVTRLLRTEATLRAEVPADQWDESMTADLLVAELSRYAIGAGRTTVDEYIQGIPPMSVDSTPERPANEAVILRGMRGDPVIVQLVFVRHGEPDQGPELTETIRMITDDSITFDIR